MTTLIAYAPSAALLFFLGAYLWIVFRILRPGAKTMLQPHAQIPLKEGLSFALRAVGPDGHRNPNGPHASAFAMLRRDRSRRPLDGDSHLWKCEEHNDR